MTSGWPMPTSHPKPWERSSPRELQALAPGFPPGHPAAQTAKGLASAVAGLKVEEEKKEV